ncbi:membrane protein insertion efficiency factor YidD [Candidatus Saganbacteria bacterium]|nr:membrane protein insertion efficiency factor YidD [Candidatus Saganbacteria bacterium]
MTKIFRYLLVLYKKTNILPSCCRYYPSCSEYADGALARFGLIKGIFLTLKRLLCCNQFFPGGYDPVPEKLDIFSVLIRKNTVLSNVSRETFERE